MVRRLVVNADDFGFTRDVNAGIIEAHRDGILTAATLMANGDAFDDAARLARRYPSLDIGVHLVLVGGHSLLDPARALPSSVAVLVTAMALGRIRIQEELRAQIQRILDAGLQPTHLDAHKHTHLLPPVLEAVAQLAGEFAIPWVRRPFDVPLGFDAPLNQRAVSRLTRLMYRRFGGVLQRHGCRSTDYFAGFQITGRFRTDDLVALIHQLPEGTTEFMCHPGHCRGALRAAPTRLKESREHELRALTDPRTKAALREAGVELVNYRQLS